jgi:hypothetical protein
VVVVGSGVGDIKLQGNAVFVTIRGINFKVNVLFAEVVVAVVFEQQINPVALIAEALLIVAVTLMNFTQCLTLPD